MKVTLVGSLIEDPAVKGVDRLRAPDGPREFLDDLSSIVEIGGEATVTVVKQRPGQRALLRIETNGPKGEVHWYGKLLRRSKAGGEESLELLRAVCESARRVGVHVPRPIAYLPRFRAIVYEAAAGNPPLPCCAHENRATAGEPTAPPSPSDRDRLFGVIGESLARLHEILPLPEDRKDRTFEQSQIDLARGVLMRHRQDLLTGFDTVRNRWWNAMCAVAPSETSPPVALHGDFYPSQVLADPMPASARPRLAILDWDGFCAGEGERDVANFEAHLILEEIRGHLSMREALDLITSFRNGYVSLRGLRLPVLSWYRQGSLLRLAALYADPAFGNHPPNPPELAEELLFSAG